jgi:hypothetical protein
MTNQHLRLLQLAVDICKLPALDGCSADRVVNDAWEIVMENWEADLDDHGPTDQGDRERAALIYTQNLNSAVRVRRGIAVA